MVISVNGYLAILAALAAKRLFELALSRLGSPSLRGRDVLGLSRFGICRSGRIPKRRS
jgi:hypothetical protein